MNILNNTKINKKDIFKLIELVGLKPNQTKNLYISIESELDSEGLAVYDDETRTHIVLMRYADLATLAHELEHVRQREHDKAFAFRYNQQLEKVGYFLNRYEIAARRVEDKYNRMIGKM